MPKKMKRILLVTFIVSLTTTTIFTIVGLWQLNAKPLSYLGQAILFFLIIWALNICYLAVIGSIAYVVMRYLNLKSTRAYLLCGVMCSLPIVVFTLNSREFEYVFASLLSGVLAGFITGAQSKKAYKKRGQIYFYILCI